MNFCLLRISLAVQRCNLFPMLHISLSVYDSLLDITQLSSSRCRCKCPKRNVLLGTSITRYDVRIMNPMTYTQKWAISHLLWYMIFTDEFDLSFPFYPYLLFENTAVHIFYCTNYSNKVRLVFINIAARKRPCKQINHYALPFIALSSNSSS